MPRPDTRMDNCRLTIIGNDNYQEGSRRTKIYSIIKENPGINIGNIFCKVRDDIKIAEVRADVRSLFADEKIEIEGWEVVTPRTMNFRTSDPGN